MTQAIPEIKKPFIEKRIKDIDTLQELNKFACMKVKSHREWYLECMECPGKKSCPVGKQAEIIMEKETKPSQENDISQETDPTRISIVDIFGQKEPVKALLKAFPNLRPPSLYAKVNAWRRRYPDLEDRYHMVEKVRFLWRKQYESMTITEILSSLYPEESNVVKVESIDVASMHPTSILSAEPISNYSVEVKKMEDNTHTAIAPNSPIITLKPKATLDADEDSISLEDFLAENSEEDSKTTIAPKESSTPNLDFLLDKLRKEKSDLESQICVIDDQINAVLTVKKMLAT